MLATHECLRKVALAKRMPQTCVDVVRIIGTMNVEQIRNDFPTLGGDLVYLDSGATSLTPEPVIRAVEQYYREYRASVHRGLYAEAARATESYEAARAKVAEFIGASSEEIIFTAGATASSNMLVYALEQSLELNVGDEIVTTTMEHHAMLVPLQKLAERKKLVLKFAPLTDDYALDTEKFAELVTDRTKIVAVIGASNVTGRITGTLPSFGEHRPVVIRDVTAWVGHAPFSVTACGADFAFFSGHKFCGPTGIGVLYGKKEWLDRLEPGHYGGGMVADVTLDGATFQMGVEGFEAGTANIGGVVGLGAAVKYLQTVGVDAVHEHVRTLVAYAQEQLEAVEEVTLYAAPAEHNVGIVSFTVEGVHPHDLAQVLGDTRVAVRAGHHCALPLHKELGVHATTRASFYLYNTKADVDALVAGIESAKDVFSL